MRLTGNLTFSPSALVQIDYWHYNSVTIKITNGAFPLVRLQVELSKKLPDSF